MQTVLLLANSYETLVCLSPQALFLITPLSHKVIFFVKLFLLKCFKLCIQNNSTHTKKKKKNIKYLPPFINLTIDKPETSQKQSPPRTMGCIYCYKKCGKVPLSLFKKKSRKTLLKYLMRYFMKCCGILVVNDCGNLMSFTTISK